MLEWATWPEYLTTPFICFINTSINKGSIHYGSKCKNDKPCSFATTSCASALQHCAQIAKLQLATDLIITTIIVWRKKLLLFIVVEYNNNNVYDHLSHDVVT